MLGNFPIYCYSTFIILLMFEKFFSHKNVKIFLLSNEFPTLFSCEKWRFEFFFLTFPFLCFYYWASKFYLPFSFILHGCWCVTFPTKENKTGNFLTDGKFGWKMNVRIIGRITDMGKFHFPARERNFIIVSNCFSFFPTCALA